MPPPAGGAGYPGRCPPAPATPVALKMCPTLSRTPKVGDGTQKKRPSLWGRTRSALACPGRRRKRIGRGLRPGTCGSCTSR
eukprot:262033-Pyramimonas_sp.AAC.1